MGVFSKGLIMTVLTRRDELGAARCMLLFSLALPLAACNTLGSDPEFSTLGGGGDRVNSAGVHQMLGPEFEEIDLVRLLAPDGLDGKFIERCGDAAKARSQAEQEAAKSCLIDSAFDAFRRDASRHTPEVRNGIQDRLIAASDQRCNVYLIYIQRHHEQNSFILGSLTSFLGGAGAIATGVTASRALAGSAGITSGVRAEYEQSYYYNQAASIISAGIRKRRAGILNQIDSVRLDAASKQPVSVQAYTPERAISDALRYHGACTLLSGLEESNVTVNVQAGLESVRQSVKTSAEIGQLLKPPQVAP